MLLHRCCLTVSNTLLFHISNISNILLSKAELFCMSECATYCKWCATVSEKGQNLQLQDSATRILILSNRPHSNIAAFHTAMFCQRLAEYCLKEQDERVERLNVSPQTNSSQHLNIQPPSQINAAQHPITTSNRAA